jgi:hypothetical protein
VVSFNTRPVEAGTPAVPHCMGENGNTNFTVKCCADFEIIFYKVLFLIIYIF